LLSKENSQFNDEAKLQRQLASSRNTAETQPFTPHNSSGKFQAEGLEEREQESETPAW
jgi:hypothetical protein